jgi:hypothetical protein
MIPFKTNQNPLKLEIKRLLSLLILFFFPLQSNKGKSLILMADLGVLLGIRKIVL